MDNQEYDAHPESPANTRVLSSGATELNHSQLRFQSVCVAVGGDEWTEPSAAFDTGVYGAVWTHHNSPPKWIPKWLPPTYYGFEWAGSCLWSNNDDARERFGYEVDIDGLPLSSDTKNNITEIISWHDTALNWESPSDPSLWTQEEWGKFNLHAIKLLEKIRQELGDEYEITDYQSGGKL